MTTQNVTKAAALRSSSVLRSRATAKDESLRSMSISLYLIS